MYDNNFFNITCQEKILTTSTPGVEVANKATGYLTILMAFTR